MTKQHCSYTASADCDATGTITRQEGHADPPVDSDLSTDYGSGATRRPTSAQLLISLLTLAVGLAVAVSLPHSKPTFTATPANHVTPRVRIADAVPETTEIEISSYGTVTPRATAPISAEVSGRVEWVAPNLEIGQFVKEGDVLAKLDTSEYEVNARKSQADITEARLQIKKIEAQARLNETVWKKNSSNDPSIFVRLEPELAAARAQLAAAQAQYDIASLNIERGTVRAPFDGRIRVRSAVPSTYVTSGTPLAEIDDTAFAWIRFPLSPSQASLLGLDLSPAVIHSTGDGLSVEVFSDTEQKRCLWHGTLIAIEGELDPGTRSLIGIAQVSNPYSPPTPGCLPLIGGSFVHATLTSPSLEQIYKIPSRAVRNGNSVFTVGSDSRLKINQIQIVYDDGETAFITHGLKPGDKIVTSAHHQLVIGLSVSPVSPGE